MEPRQAHHGELAAELAALQLQLNHAEDGWQTVCSCEADAQAAGEGQEPSVAAGHVDHACRLLIEEIAEGALMVSRAGVVVYANRAFATLLGRPQHETIGRRIEDCFAPEAHPRLARVLGARGGLRRRMQLDLLTAGGRRVATRLSTGQLQLPGAPELTFLVVKDLTPQRRHDAALAKRESALQDMRERQQRTENHLQEVLAAIPAHVALLDTRGVIVSVNEAWKQFAKSNGYQGGDFGIGQNYADLCGGVSEGQDAHDAASAAEHIRSVLSGQSAEAALEYPCHSPTEDRWFRMTVAALKSGPDGGTVDGAIVMHINISERKQAESAERTALAEKLLIARAVEQSAEGLMVTDSRRRIVKVNHAFEAITGYADSDVLGRTPRLLSSGRQDRTFYEAMWAAVETSGHWRGEIWSRRKDGTVYPLSMSVSRLDDADGQPMNYVASFSDISERKAAEERVRRMAHFDALTGLPNRALLVERAAHELRIAHRSDGQLALMFIDLDHFKHINDSLGHAVGDGLLVALAERFQQALREQDTLARSGGDEFVLLLPGTDAPGAAHVAQKLLALASLPYRVDRHELSITPSIGIALYPVDGEDFGALARAADAAMYRAKQGGRNRFRFHTADIHAQSARMLQLENALRQALAHSEFSLRYQPQFDGTGQQIVGAEALLRWHNRELGTVSPAEFIAIAESSGLITSIGEWVLRTASQQMRAWLDDGLAPLTLAVNLSAVQFRQPNLTETVTRIVGEAGIAPELLELELTESVASDDPAAAVTVMNELHAHGVRMSIDDFGTGYSSLSYLKRFKVDRLKIDRSFVGSLPDSGEDQAIVKAIISLARSLGMKTIAEGVETQAQARFLREQGCDEMQGYWFSRPLTAGQFARFAKAHHPPAAGRPG
ncbi:EAL and GGDEF domain-containing protein [Roseateles cellulosilyticus]|uniref:EAL domain-containing protein n=1 Tax=Pelomonas cellulosilytica TaxID=2906762 RepID=A0ABS8XSN8_9BURK|nr:bifunctional diguanylate cyclase/phosphodiesterase [Pelomonas sp. P8]MCE4553626.1 EAL domain-containing protein [Pelomonas sp. P8]